MIGMGKKNRLILADYISFTDKEGKPLGHPLKILREYAEWVESRYDVIYAAHPTYLENLQGTEILSLPYKISEGKDYTSIKGKLNQLFTSWKNISCIFAYERDSLIWFCNIDVFLVFYLFFHKKNRKRVIITTYLKDYSSEYQNKMFFYVLRFVRLVICSNLDNKYAGKNKLYVPDYLYDVKIYSRYQRNAKSEKAVCVGTMGKQKELKKLIEVFNESGYPLEIIGHFSDKKLYSELCNVAKKNVVVKDVYLQYEEYLRLISEAKFCVLPYRKDAYATKTSGVLLESVFLQAIPISNIELLQNWNVYGIGYHDLSELKSTDLYQVESNTLLDKNKELITKMYNKEVYIELLLSMIES